MSLPSDRTDGGAHGRAHNIVYLAKHPCYQFALSRPAQSDTCPPCEPCTVELWFANQTPQQRIVLTLGMLEEFHDALSRLMDFVKCEEARRDPSISPTECP